MKKEDLYIGLRVVDTDGDAGTIVELGKEMYKIEYDYGDSITFYYHNVQKWLKPLLDGPIEGFQVKDSGARQEYASGMVRDTQEGKPDFTLLPLDFLERWATHMTKGAEKYGRENWTLASSEEELTRFKGSAFRHLIQWLRGDLDEDHAAAVAFNIAAAERVKGYLHGQ